MASNLLKQQDAANSTYFGYDVLNRRTKKNYPDTTYAYFRYDAVSNLTGAQDARGWTYFGYDALNRITQEMRLPATASRTCMTRGEPAESASATGSRSSTTVTMRRAV